MQALIGEFLLSMTRLERKEAELEKLYQYRQAALRNNDLMWLTRNQAKIDALEKEVIECRKYAPTTLKSLLDGKDEDFKNDFYVGMLRISLLSDAVNEACAEVRGMFKDLLGEDNFDFSLRKEVDEMNKLSQRIASFAILPNDHILEDCIVNDDKFVDCCMKLATKHLESKLKIKKKK